MLVSLVGTTADLEFMHEIHLDSLSFRAFQFPHTKLNWQCVVRQLPQPFNVQQWIKWIVWSRTSCACLRTNANSEERKKLTNAVWNSRGNWRGTNVIEFYFAFFSHLVAVAYISSRYTTTAVLVICQWMQPMCKCINVSCAIKRPVARASLSQQIYAMTPMCVWLKSRCNLMTLNLHTVM